MPVALKTNKLVRIKRQHGHTLQVVREHYLRDDVPCNSALCMAGCQPTLTDSSKPAITLPGDVTHYVVPDVDTVLKYLEILELNQLSGVLFMQTVTHAVQHEGGRKHFRRVQGVLQVPGKRSVMFHNEFQRYAYCAREPGESMKDWQARSVYEACVWYYDHLAGQMPLVMITTDEKVAREYGSRHLGVFVITVRQYLQQFWPDVEEAQHLYESLSLAWQSSLSKDKDFTGYLSSEVLEAGLKSGQLVTGNLQVSKHSAATEAFVRRKGAGSKDLESGEDILIAGAAERNRAVHGDAVVVELLPRLQWKSRSNALKENSAEAKQGDDEDSEAASVCATGRVVGILQRNWRDYVVSLAQEEVGNANRAGKVLVIPWDWRVPKIRISTRQVDALRNHRFIVRIDHWEADSQYPNGHFVRSLGPADQLETHIAALLIEHEISVPAFMDAVLKEMPVNTAEKPWRMDGAEVERRRDLRDSHLIFSIDPKGCEDVDDTLSVRKLPNGNLELGVHIADVTHFVKPNSACDLEARSRSTTVYLADRRYDMLPGILSSDLCSLISGVDRYAVSVVWELDADYEVKDVWYGRSVIRSKYKLFYEIAQEMQEGATDSTLIENIPELQSLSADGQCEALAELRAAVRMLMQTARGLRSKRTAHGALELEGVEVRVEMSDTKAIQDLVPKQSLEIHETIEECMIFANHWVAKKICQSFPNQALLRHHPLPREHYFKNLVTCARSQGFEVQTHSNKALADSLDQCVCPHDPHVNKILRNLATQAMSNAAYFCTGALPRDQFFHYGLALDFYTHFTSPIRRYADVIVHRLLLAAVSEEGRADLMSNKSLEELSGHINTKHRAAQHAQRESQLLYQTLFFKERPNDDEACVVNAVVFEVRSNGLMVFIPRYGIKGAVYLRSKDGQVVYVPHNCPAEWVGGTLTQTAESVTVNSAYGTQRYQLFDHITVRISVQEMHAHPAGLRLELLYNKMHLSDAEIFEAKAQKGAIIKRVRQRADEQRRAQHELVDLGEHYPEWRRLYGQTDSSKSFYALLQSFHDTALLDV